VPRRTPVKINAGLADPKLKSWFADLGAAVFSGSPTDFGNGTYAAKDRRESNQ
jgi:hypothetical protein